MFLGLKVKHPELGSEPFRKVPQVFGSFRTNGRRPKGLCPGFGVAWARKWKSKFQRVKLKGKERSQEVKNRDPEVELKEASRWEMPTFSCCQVAPIPLNGWHVLWCLFAVQVQNPPKTKTANK